MSEQLAKLQEGNKRYAANQPGAKDFAKARAETLEGQKPYAIVLACSDSRVPPEHIFDAGLGEVFVVRSAGNVVDRIALGSIEYAAEHLHVPLLVVLGHERCGAVKAAWDAVTVSSSGSPVPKPETENTEHAGAPGAEPHKGNIQYVLKKIESSVKKARRRNRTMEEAADENVKRQIKEIIKKSALCKRLVDEGRLKIVGAKYRLGSGGVDFFQ